MVGGCPVSTAPVKGGSRVIKYLSIPAVLLATWGCMRNESVTEEGGSAVLSDQEAKELLQKSEHVEAKLPEIRGDRAAIPTSDQVSVVKSLEFPTVTDEIQNSLPALSPAPLAKSSAYVRTVNYNSPQSISWTPDQSWNSFTFAPFYIHNLDISWGYTVPQTNNHYHLFYEGANLCDFHTNVGKIGIYSKRMTWNQAKCEYEGVPICTGTNIDAKDFPRYIGTHYANDWIKFFVSNNGQTPRVFDLVSIKIRAADPNLASCKPGYGQIQIWVKKAATQQWLYWQALNPGYLWSPYPADGNGIDEIRLTSPNAHHFTADDLTVRVP